jgi:hypothetical protein
LQKTDPSSRQRGRPTKKQDRNCQTVINIWSSAPDGARHQDLLTDRQSQCDFDFDYERAHKRENIRDKPTFLSERMLHKDYNRKGSVGKNLCS